MKKMSLEEIEKRIEEINKKEELTDTEKEELSRLRIQKMYIAPPVVANNKIDLKIYDKPNYYLIFLHNTKILIGSINYRGYHCSDYSGDAECNIVPYYRGNGYAYEALKLLGEKLYEDKILDIWVSAHSNNLASIKTIEKYGGKRIKPQSHSDKDVLLFECKTYPRRTIEDNKRLSESNKDDIDIER